MAGRPIPAGLIAVGFERVTANSTAVAVNSTIRSQATMLHISVENQSVRYRMDSTAPTQNTGVLLTAANSPYWFNYDGTAGFRVVRGEGEGEGATVVQIQGYKHPGQRAR